MLQAWTIICPFTGVKLRDRAEDSSSGSQRDKEQLSTLRGIGETRLSSVFCCLMVYVNTFITTMQYDVVERILDLELEKLVF